LQEGCKAGEKGLSCLWATETAISTTFRLRYHVANVNVQHMAAEKQEERTIDASFFKYHLFLQEACGRNSTGTHAVLLELRSSRTLHNSMSELIARTGIDGMGIFSEYAEACAKRMILDLLLHLQLSHVTSHPTPVGVSVPVSNWQGYQ